jgi:poly-gamma-glutamate synthesis protein (capsule biosynthesis protein)
MERRGVLYPAEAIGDWMQAGDITHISNEVSFWSECPFPDPVQEQLKFCSHLDYFQLLESIGVDVVELTGNHNKDFGADPFLTTLELYRQVGWFTFGGGEDLADAVQPAIIEHNGNRIAFLGCNQPGPRYAWATESSPGAAPCDEPALLAETERLRSEGVLPIFTFQWAELNRPSTSQRQAFQAAAEAGAVIVSGSQAHQPQPMEFYEDAFIHYGLGNLFFDQMQSLALRQQFVDRHVIYDGRHISTELLTSLLENYARPRPMRPEERDAFLVEIFQDSGW